jgi:hypothetical protein
VAASANTETSADTAVTVPPEQSSPQPDGNVWGNSGQGRPKEHREPREGGRGRGYHNDNRRGRGGGRGGGHPVPDAERRERTKNPVPDEGPFVMFLGNLPWKMREQDLE